MGVVLTLSLVRARVRVMALAAGFGLFELVVALSYASVDQNAVRTLVESLPPALRALAGSADVATATGYLGSAYIHPVALTIQGALVISMASAPARDTETGAAELLLSRPLPPWRWLAAQSAAVAVALVVVAAGGYLGGLAGALAVDDLSDVAPGALLRASAGGVLVFLAVGGVTLLAGVLTRTGARAVGWAAGFAVVSYAVDYLAEIWTVAEPLGPLSVFHHYDPGLITGTGTLPADGVAFLVTVALATTVAAHVLVQRRELAPAS
jgi:hypothetical protein